MKEKQQTLVLPTVVSGDLKTMHPLEGVVLGVAPHIAPSGGQAAQIVEFGRQYRYDPSGKNIPTDLGTMLGNDEVLYLVLGKWPPTSPTGLDTSTFGPSLEQPSEGAIRLSSMLDQGARVNLVIGKWPPTSDAGGKKICSCCKRPL